MLAIPTLRNHVNPHRTVHTNQTSTTKQTSSSSNGLFKLEIRLYFTFYRSAPKSEHFSFSLISSKLVLVTSGNDDVVDLEHHSAELCGKDELLSL